MWFEKAHDLFDWRVCINNICMSTSLHENKHLPQHKICGAITRLWHRNLVSFTCLTWLLFKKESRKGNSNSLLHHFLGSSSFSSFGYCKNFAHTYLVEVPDYVGRPHPKSSLKRMRDFQVFSATQQHTCGPEILYSSWKMSWSVREGGSDLILTKSILTLKKKSGFGTLSTSQRLRLHLWKERITEKFCYHHPKVWCLFCPHFLCFQFCCLEDFLPHCLL